MGGENFNILYLTLSFVTMNRHNNCLTYSILDFMRDLLRKFYPNKFGSNITRSEKEWFVSKATGSGYFPMPTSLVELQNNQ